MTLTGLVDRQLSDAGWALIFGALSLQAISGLGVRSCLRSIVHLEPEKVSLIVGGLG